MRNHLLLAMSVTILALPLAACNEPETVAAEQTFGPSPTLPAPQKSWIPTVNVATAIGWPGGTKPVADNVSKKYLHLYVAELQFRYNNRFNDDIFGTAIEGA